MSDSIPLHKSDCALLLFGYELTPECTCGFYQRNSKTPPALAAEPTKPEPVPLAKDCPEDWPKDWLNMTLWVNSGDRVLSIKSSLHLSKIKQSRGLAVQLAADTAWRQLDAAMKEVPR
jgi:hypothetical protein